MPPSVASSIVTASTMWPSRLAGFHATLAPSSACSQSASASAIACEGGQVKPRGMLLPFARTVPALCDLADFAAEAAGLALGFADALPATVNPTARPTATRERDTVTLTITARAGQS